MRGAEGRKQDRIISYCMAVSIGKMHRELETTWGSDSSVALVTIICFGRLRSTDEVDCDFLRSERFCCSIPTVGPADCVLRLQSVIKGQSGSAEEGGRGAGNDSRRRKEETLK